MAAELSGLARTRSDDHHTRIGRVALHVMIKLCSVCVLLLHSAMAAPTHAEDTSCNHGVDCTVELQLANTQGDQHAVVAVGRHDHITVTVPASFTRRLHAGMALFTPLADGFAFSTLDVTGMALLHYDLPADLTRDAAVGSLPFATLPTGDILLRRDLASGLIVSTPALDRGQFDEPGVYLLRPLLHGDHSQVAPVPLLLWRYLQPARRWGGLACIDRALRQRAAVRAIRRTPACAPGPRPSVLFIAPHMVIDLTHGAAMATVTAVVLFPDGFRVTASGRTRADGSWHKVLVLAHRPARAALPAILSIVLQRQDQAVAHAVDLAIAP